MPGAASGKGGAGTVDYDSQVALRPLTVDFREPKFAQGVSGENAFTLAKGFNFQLSGRDRQQAKYEGGPANAQALNRFSYVLNNPLRYTDPTGHWTVAITIGGIFFAGLAARGSITFAFDGEGNFSVFIGIGGGAATGAGVGAGPGISFTTAPTINELAGRSVQIGGQLGLGPGVNVEGVIFTDGKRRYVGANLGGRLILEGPLPAVAYGAFQHDWMLYKTNIPALIFRFTRNAIRIIDDFTRRTTRDFIDNSPLFPPHRPKR